MAEDPKTRESGLVPEEYVRLLRDIEGGWSSLSGEAEGQGVGDASPEEAGVGATPTGDEAEAGEGERTAVLAGGEKEKSKVIVSSFSTSSRDLNPYPHPLLGTQTGQPPPQVVHYGSQNATPVMSPVLGGGGKKGGAEGSALKMEEGVER